MREFTLTRQMHGMIRNRPRQTNLAENDQVLLYPTFASRAEDERAWRLRVHGCVFQTGPLTLRKRFMLRLLRGVMRVGREALETDIFQERIHGFLTYPLRKRCVTLQAGDWEFPLPKRSLRNGQFSGMLRLSDEQASVLPHTEGPGGQWLNVGLQSPHATHRQANGRIQLIEPSGYSIVSDIDDTIKHTEVGCRRALLSNTFLRDFRSIEGMAQAYRVWKEQGAAFHYVSSSPWQLYSPLYNYLLADAFPEGSIHLRSFRLRDHMLRRLWWLRRRGKSVVIRTLIEAFPQRRFLLVGDSGESDPEIYIGLARQFPNQVAGILIRELDHRPMNATRIRKLCKRVPESLLSIFRSADELPRDLPLAAQPLV